ncbi:MAG: family 10 glycosylhydrolase, partial [Pirellulales bacterium]|nr:family 10 glycosylhydrolase [Pirellulales bacterium]
PLGIEADEPGSMWMENGRLHVAQKSPRLYDGLDIDVSSNKDDAVLRIELLSPTGAAQEAVIEIPTRDLAGMVGERAYNANLDDRGTRLLVRRMPGDMLRLKFDRKSLIFTPGEKLELSVLPRHIPDLNGNETRIKIDIYADRGERPISSQQTDTKLSEIDGPIVMNVELPQDEGVYDLVVSAQQVPSVRLPGAVSLPVGLKHTVAQRKLQLVVLSKEKPQRPKDESSLKTVTEIDPVNPNWWKRLAKSAEDLSRLKLSPQQAFGKGPLGSGHRSTRKHALGELVELSPINKPGQTSWEAYTLPIRKPGSPHVLEVEYPSDVSQTMGISVLEPNAAGALLPIQLDSGVDVAEELVTSDTQKPQILRHRLIFWPRSDSPIVLITNQRHDRPVVYGRIRVLAGWEHLPKAYEVDRKAEEYPKRLTAAYLDRPLFPESFSASESYDSWSRRSLDDWMTFHEGALRTIEYLQYAGMDGLMISVLADGSTIYPSRFLEPTPRYDKGVFFDSGQDPIRKDVLEMLLRMFDRQGLRLIPALEFAGPLPQLEALLREGGADTVGMRWIGPYGQTWQDTYRPQRHRAPYYNVLHPHVQEAMLNVVDELLENYSGHESMAGLALQLSGYGYAQLPGPDWGMDDATVGQFQIDTGIRVDGDGASDDKGDANFNKRFLKRQKALTGPYRKQWLEWRARRLSRFYYKLQEKLTKAKPGARLYLAGADCFESEEMQKALRPMLPRRATMAEMLLLVGIDEAHYHDPNGVVLLRPQRISPLRSNAADAASLEIDQMPDRDTYFSGLPYAGSLFFHQPQEMRLESFDRKSPFRSSYTMLSSQIVPSDSRNRRRFIHGLATLDPQVMFEGGWLIPLGQEDSSRRFLAAYRNLPAVRFKRLANSTSPNDTQPVTVRHATHGDHTYLYAANDSPLATTVNIRVGTAGSALGLEELSGLREVPPLKRDDRGTFWEITLEPYDLVAVRLSRPDARLYEPTVSLAKDVEDVLDKRIRDLSVRANELRAPPLLKVLANSDFEQTTPKASEKTDQKADERTRKIPGWLAIEQEGTLIEFMPTDVAKGVQKPHGKHSLRMHSDGPSVSLVSKPFQPPSTGRLKMFVWLRVPEAAKQPTLQWSLVGKLNGQEFSRVAVVGRTGAHPIADRWGWYEFPINSLPLDGMSEARVRFDLFGPGEVLIDDVQLSHLEFEENELKALGKLIQTAVFQLRRHQVGDCIHLLEGYWPRFLVENVPAPAPTVESTTESSLAHNAKPRVAAKPEREEPQKKPQEKERGWFDRMKGIFPKKLW